MVDECNDEGDEGDEGEDEGGGRDQVVGVGRLRFRDRKQRASRRASRLGVESRRRSPRSSVLRFEGACDGWSQS
jgi:hypothetical protein